MRAFVLDKYGRDQLLRECDVPMPKIGPDDVLVEIFAASVNPIDAKIRDGAFKLILPYQLPFVMGNDLAGVVADVGSNVRRFSIGDEVYARPAKNRIGTFAQYIAISESDVTLKPANISMAQAASIPLVGLTSWQALVERADLQRGQKVLIHAGSGGVGTFAIQLARHLGATVATTASSSSAAMLKELGADIVVDYRNEDFSEILKDYDVALNTLNDSVLGKTVKVLKPGGRLISISGPPDRQFAIDNKLSWTLQQVMRVLSYRIRSKAARAGVSYSFLFMKPDGTQLGKITQLVESGIIRPVTDEIFPFEKTNEAIAYVDSGRAKGKVIIQMK